nr:neoverrucotoxin subunit alpha-like [Labrus bergylta]
MALAKGCRSLASALTSNPSHLKELDLSYNHPGITGLTLLTGLQDSQSKLDTLRLEPAGVQWLTPGLMKYSCELTIDTNTVNHRIQLSDNNRKGTLVEGSVLYPDHPDRFDPTALLCREGLTGRCYWEIEWTGGVFISVSYRGISRKENNESGRNDQSWSLSCRDNEDEVEYSVLHNNVETPITRSSSQLYFSSPPQPRTEQRCIWTTLLALCPSTASPPTH